MTPVQLPEVPEPVDAYARAAWGPKPDYYTAAQLREYATEAVRQYANAIFAEGWYLACDWASRDDLKFDVDSPAFEADRAARIGNLLTSLESEK